MFPTQWPTGGPHEWTNDTVRTTGTTPLQHVTLIGKYN